MTDCDKKKKKAYIGFAFIVIVAMMGALKKSGLSIVGEGAALLLILLLTAGSVVMLVPYIRCLSEHNRRHKPPYSK